MAITLKSVHNWSGTGASPVTLSPSGLSSTGNMMIVLFYCPTAVTITAVTDNKSNTYTVNGTSATYTGCNLFAAYSFGAATGITSFIVTYTGSGGTGITAYDCGSTSGGAFDAIAGLSSQSSANPAPSITAAAAGIAVTILGAGSNASAVASPFTLDTTGNQFAGFNYGSHDVNGSGGSLTSTFTATNAAWCSLMATFKEVSAPAGGPTNLLMLMGCGT